MGIEPIIFSFDEVACSSKPLSSEVCANLFWFSYIQFPCSPNAFIYRAGMDAVGDLSFAVIYTRFATVLIFTIFGGIVKLTQAGFEPAIRWFRVSCLKPLDYWAKMGLDRLELPTSCLSDKRSNQLNYNPLRWQVGIEPTFFRSTIWRINQFILQPQWEVLVSNQLLRIFSPLLLPS